MRSALAGEGGGFFSGTASVWGGPARLRGLLGEGEFKKKEEKFNRSKT